MEKINKIQKRNVLNDLYRVDKPGIGGAYHRYKVFRNDNEIAIINFQNGPRNEEGSVAGVTEMDLLEIVRDRLRCFQYSPDIDITFPARENAIAIRKIEEAIMWLNKRSEDRAERGVLGYNKE